MRQMNLEPIIQSEVSHKEKDKYQEPQIFRWHKLYGKKLRGTKEPLDESERGE